MRLFPLGLGLFLLLCALPHPVRAEQANGCPEFSDPKIILTPLVTSPRYVGTLNLAQIQEIAAKDHKNVAGTQHEIPVGLTASSLKLDSRFEVMVQSSPADPLVCAQITQLSLTFGFNDTTVYLAQELPYASCSYNTVLEHETRHVGIDQGLVGVFASILPDILRKAVRSIGVIRASSPKRAEELLRDVMKNYMDDLGTNLSIIRQEHQLKIDTHEEYGRLSKSCNGDLARLISRAAAPP